MSERWSYCERPSTETAQNQSTPVLQGAERGANREPSCRGTHMEIILMVPLIVLASVFVMAEIGYLWLPGQYGRVH